MALIIFGMVLPWLLVGVGCWFGLQLVRQNGRFLLRLESLELRLAEIRSGPASEPAADAPAGLARSEDAPEFELPDLNGKRRSLKEFRGKPVLLMFFGPRCGYCIEALSGIASMPLDGHGGAPVPLVITNGSKEENRRLMDQHGVRCPVLLQNEMEVAGRYKAYGTPMGYLIDEQGKIASDLAIGSQALLALAKTPTEADRGSKTPEAPVNGKARVAKGNRPLSTSRLTRDGLKKGTIAPDFRLPTVAGGTLTLDDLRGKMVLLVFSDPECGPCDDLAPRLEQIHRQRSDPQVVVVSRQDMEKNRKKAAALGISYPVAVQNNWDVSMRYGMFATPIGYLIDERGVIASDVAVGVEPILGLVKGASSSVEKPPPASTGLAVSRTEPQAR